MQDKADRETILIQLRRERGLTSGGDYRISMEWLNRLVLQSGLTLGIGKLALFAGIGALMRLRRHLCRPRRPHAGRDGRPVLPPLLPYLVLRVLRGRRQKKFGAQFPDAIDIIVRSLRAGHPVPIAITMVAREMADPIGSEFGIVADEITYGADLETAMRNLYYRIGQDDLPLFVTAVAIQSLHRRQSRRDPGKPVGGDPRALQDAPQDPRAGFGRPRLGADPFLAADRHVLRRQHRGAELLRQRLA